MSVPVEPVDGDDWFATPRDPSDTPARDEPMDIASETIPKIVPMSHAPTNESSRHVALGSTNKVDCSEGALPVAEPTGPIDELAVPEVPQSPSHLSLEPHTSPPLVSPDEGNAPSRLPSPSRVPMPVSSPQKQLYDGTSTDRCNHAIPTPRSAQVQSGDSARASSSSLDRVENAHPKGSSAYGIKKAAKRVKREAKHALQAAVLPAAEDKNEAEKRDALEVGDVAQAEDAKVRTRVGGFIESSTAALRVEVQGVAQETRTAIGCQPPVSTDSPSRHTASPPEASSSKLVIASNQDVISTKAPFPQQAQSEPAPVPEPTAGTGSTLEMAAGCYPRDVRTYLCWFGAGTRPLFTDHLSQSNLHYPPLSKLRAGSRPNFIGVILSIDDHKKTAKGRACLLKLHHPFGILLTLTLSAPSRVHAATLDLGPVHIQP